MPGKPTFGSDLTKLLFEQIDHVTIDLIKTFVLNSLVEWEPRISVTGINVKYGILREEFFCKNF